MYTEEEIQAFVHDFKHLWGKDIDKHALIRYGIDKYQIYYKPDHEIYLIEVQEVNKRICTKMIEAGVEILDEIPTKE